jgi:hypothetical protein
MSEAAEIDSCDKAGAGGGDPASLEAIIAAATPSGPAEAGAWRTRATCNEDGLVGMIDAYEPIETLTFAL